MKIGRGAQTPGRIEGKSVGRAAETPPPSSETTARQTDQGIHSSVRTPSSRSAAGLLLQEMRRARPSPGGSGAEELDAARARQAMEARHDAAEVNMAMAIAGSATSVTAAGIGTATAGASALQELAIGQRKALVDTIGALKQGATEAATGAFGKVFEGAGRKTDVNSLVQHVLRQSYLDQFQDLASAAGKLKEINDQKQAIRDHVNGLKASGTPSDLEKEIEKWEEKLRSIGDDAQLANIDLQNMLQKQQSLMQTLSNISKVLYETAMATIRKIG
jgi:hypothetical protein